MPDAVLDPRRARRAEVTPSTASRTGTSRTGTSRTGTSLDATWLNAVVMRVPKRAQTTDPDRLRRTFVAIDPVGAVLRSPGHQVLFGRRGTGKTHALRYLAETVRREGHVATYLDLRAIGSSGGFSESAVTDGALLEAAVADGARARVQRRATHALVDVVGALHGALWDAILDLDLDDRVMSLIAAMDRVTETTTRVSAVEDGAE